MSVWETRRAGLTPLAVVGAVALAAVGCGNRERRGADSGARAGGTLVALWAGDVDNIDPGITYAQGGTQIVRATQKVLYRPRVDDATRTDPDLADEYLGTAAPHLAAGGGAGAVKVQVAGADAVRARELLALRGGPA